MSHAIGHSQRLAFRAPNAERCEHIDDPHSTGTLKEDRVER
jgi:hypothetical protein